MKILDILEAKYYGRHSADAVFKRLVDRTNIQTDSQHKLMSYIYDVEMKHGVVKARIYLYDVDSEQQAISQAERLLHQHGIPFTDIGEGNQTGQSRWVLVMTYNPTVTEARYYGRHTVDDVRNRLEKIARDHNKSENVRILEAWMAPRAGHHTSELTLDAPDEVVFAHLYIVDADSKQDAENEIRLYLKKFGIPYTGIYDLQQAQRRWEATMIYDPS